MATKIEELLGKKRKAEDIIDYARNLKQDLGTNDPYKIADYYGIQVMIIDQFYTDYPAQTIRSERYPTFISINSKYDDFSRKVLCAHELGHALMHSGINHFAFTKTNLRTNVEYEANLFAVALLTDNNINDKIITPLERLTGYTLKSILDYNIHIK